MAPVFFPPVTTDGNMVRVLSCSGGRSEWVYRANDAQWILQHYAATGDGPCDGAQPLAKGEPCRTAHRAGKQGRVSCDRVDYAAGMSDTQLPQFLLLHVGTATVLPLRLPRHHP